MTSSGSPAATGASATATRSTASGRASSASPGPTSSALNTGSVDDQQRLAGVDRRVDEGDSLDEIGLGVEHDHGAQG